MPSSHLLESPADGLTRRAWLQVGFSGFLGLGLASLPGQRAVADEAKRLQRTGKAKSVIFVFLTGAPSHLDTFDPKPTLTKLHGKPLPESFPRPVTAMGKTAHTPLLASTPEKQREALMRAIPFRRFAKPSEVADAILFFASDRSSYLTGQVLSVSGGLTMVD